MSPVEGRDSPTARTVCRCARRRRKPVPDGLAALVAVALAALVVAGSADGAPRGTRTSRRPPPARARRTPARRASADPRRHVPRELGAPAGLALAARLVPGTRARGGAEGPRGGVVRQFSHTPCGADFTASVRRAGYRYRRFGENLFAGPWGRVTARDVVAAWLKSPGHRANILGRASATSAPPRACERPPRRRGLGRLDRDLRVAALDAEGLARPAGNGFSCATRAISTTCARRSAATSSG